MILVRSKSLILPRKHSRIFNGTISLMTTYFFDLDKQIIETIEKRYVILLDTSVWIHLADGKTAYAVELRDRLLKLEAQEKIFCPLTPPTIWELRKQSSPTLHRTAELMETLSKNVSFRGLDQIFDYEIASFLEYMRTGKFSPLTTFEKFGSLFSYLAPGFKIESQPNDIPLFDSKFYEHFSSVVKNLKLTQLISMLGEKSFPNVGTARNQQATNQARRKIAGNSIEKARRIEIEWIAKNIVIPRFNKQRSKLPIEEQFKILQSVNKLPKTKKYGSAIEHIINFMPAIYALAETYTISALDPNRKDHPNDFFDCQILIYGLSYSAIFSAIDGWIASLVRTSRERSKFPGFFNFAGSLDELDRNIDSMLHNK